MIGSMISCLYNIFKPTRIEDLISKSIAINYLLIISLCLQIALFYFKANIFVFGFFFILSNLLFVANTSISMTLVKNLFFNKEITKIGISFFYAYMGLNSVFFAIIGFVSHSNFICLILSGTILIIIG